MPASYSTRSPKKSPLCEGPHTMVSPPVWPAPAWMIRTSSLPIMSVSSPRKARVGQVSPGIVSAPRKRRGKRPISLFISASPLSRMRPSVASLAMTCSALYAFFRHKRRGLRVDHHDAVVADDDAGVRIAFGGEGIAVLREPLEADLLRLEVALRGKGFHPEPFRNRVIQARATDAGSCT